VALLVETLRCKPEGRGFEWNFQWYNPSSRARSLGSNQRLTEMSAGNIFWGLHAACVYGWQPYHLHVLTVSKSGSLISWNPQALLQACTKCSYNQYKSIN